MRFEVTTWNNGQSKPTGAGYGIRIKSNDYIFFKDWKIITVGKSQIIRKSTTPFKATCPEIRSKVIGEFLIENDMSEWKKGQPKKLFLHQIDENEFELKIN